MILCTVYNIWVIPGQIMQWVEQHRLRFCLKLVYGVIHAENDEISNFRSIGVAVQKLWGSKVWGGSKTPQS